MQPLTIRQLKNFWNKVEKTPTCWNWTGHTAFGYGRFGLDGDAYLAHKVSMVIAGFLKNPRKHERGSAGMIVMHTCDNRLCVNPKHLRVATQKENMADAKIKGRKWNGELSGENNPRAKLHSGDIPEIRNLIGKLTYRRIAEVYGVTSSQIYCIKTGKSWANI